MKPLILGSTVLFAAIAAVALATTLGKPLSASAARELAYGTPATESEVERGRYLVNGFGCADCHTPHVMGPAGPERDLSRNLSGHPADLKLPAAPVLPPGPWVATVAGTMTAWSGPWGTSYPANLTPDMETGLGKWTAEEFVATLKTGRHMGRGREILPPMPIPATRNLTEEDLRAMYAYLRTIPAVKNRVPDPLPPAPAR
jgi:mono/diheme cytochrome c family protein